MIVDAFTFCDEAEVLEIRLNLLDKLVDEFVLIESTQTFRGNPRTPIARQLLDNRLARWKNRVRVTTLTHLLGDTPWEREAFQRDTIARALDYPDDTLALISDVDEVPNPTRVREWVDKAADHPVSFVMQMHYFRLNVRTPWRSMYLPVLTTAKRIREYGAQWIRNAGSLETVADGGWEWSWLGDANANVRKLRSFAHEEYDTPEARDPTFFDRALEQMRDPFGRFTLEPVELTPRNGYPEWLCDWASRDLIWEPARAA